MPAEWFTSTRKANRQATKAPDVDLTRDEWYRLLLAARGRNYIRSESSESEPVMKRIQQLCILFLLATTVQADDQKVGYRPESGFIPNAKTAIAVAEPILMAIYGEKTIKDERPFKADLTNGIWTVHGSLPKGFRGGVALIEISKSDACVIRVTHGKQDISKLKIKAH